jgi:hypothetical protein
MLKLAEQHVYLLVSPLGYNKHGGYGTCCSYPPCFEYLALSTLKYIPI